MTLIIPSAAEIADSLNVWKMGGDLRVLAHACRSKAPEYCQPNPDGATRLLRAAAAMELAADLVDAMGKEGGSR
jgi:hypothetical protein